MKELPAYIGFGAAFLIALAIFGLGARNLRRGWASTHWPTTRGEVVESSMGATAATTARGSRNSTNSTMYLANIQFEYEVDGRKYRTDQMHIGQTVGSGDSSEAELRRYRYPLGAKVSVSYDPADPAIATVEPGFNEEVLWLPGAGLAFGAVALMGVAFYRSANSSGMALGLTLFCVIFMAVGSVILFYGGRSLWRDWESRKWPTTRGVIVYGKTDESVSTAATTDGEFEEATSGARLIFRYEVDGRTHYANTRRFGQLAGSSGDWAQEIRTRFPLGREVKVAYRPDNPDLATLETGVSKEALWAPGAGAAFFLFGLAVLLFGVPMVRSF